jgi:hypothetical protein
MEAGYATCSLQIVRAAVLPDGVAHTAFPLPHQRRDTTTLSTPAAHTTTTTHPPSDHTHHQSSSLAPSMQPPCGTAYHSRHVKSPDALTDSDRLIVGPLSL